MRALFQMINWMDVFLAAGALLVATIVIGMIFSRLYRRATKEISFVRTGFRGQKLILNGGAIVLPVLHDTIPVNMNTLRLEVLRANQQALITLDRMRVDVMAEFYVRVKPTQDAIASAAQTLGLKTMNPDELKNLVEGKFVDALRAVAAEMAMEELHEQRVDFVQKVQQVVSEDLLKNGLELESVSLTGLDQTSKEHFNPDNAFDAEGLTKIESKQKVDSYNIEAERTVEESRIEKDRTLREKEIAKEKSVETVEIERKKSIELSEQDRAIAVAEKSKAQSEAQVEADRAKALAVKEEEAVATVRETEKAQRAKAVELVAASQAAERETIRIKVAAEAEKLSALDRAEALRTIADAEAEKVRIQARGEADSEKLKAEAAAKRYEVEAARQASHQRVGQHPVRRTDRHAASHCSYRASGRNCEGTRQTYGEDRRN